MVEGSNVGSLGMVAVAVVSTGVILASYHLIHCRRLEPDPKFHKKKKKKKKKKVRFADDVKGASDSEECRARNTAAGSGKMVRPALRKAAGLPFDSPCLLSMVL